MNTKKISIWVIAAIAVLLVLYFVFHHHKPQHRTESGTAVRNVTITTIHKKDINDFYEATGAIQAGTISVISSRIMGAVTDIFVKQGDKVTAGQELLLIDDSDLTQHVNAARAAYNESVKEQQAAKSNKTLAETTYKRYKQLYDEKAITSQEMDQITNQKQLATLEFQRAQAAVEAAEANLKQAQVNLGFSRIASPIDGVVTHKNIDKGTMASPGIPLMTVEDNINYKAEVSVDEKMANQVYVSMPVKVEVDSIPAVFKGTINEIAPSIDTSSRTFIVKALIIKDPNDRRLANGLYARVLIPQKSRSILAIPTAAIVRKGQLTGVYVVTDDNRTNYRMIRTGKTFGSDIEVLAGLNEDEKIATSGVEDIYEGEIIGSDNN
jgi:RND family efflux transporter MFP subunit